MNWREEVLTKAIKKLESMSFATIIPEGYSPEMTARYLKLNIAPPFAPNPNQRVHAASSVFAIVDMMFQNVEVSFREPDGEARFITALTEYFTAIKAIGHDPANSEDVFTQRAVNCFAALMLRQEDRAKCPKTADDAPLVRRDIMYYLNAAKRIRGE